MKWKTGFKLLPFKWVNFYRYIKEFMNAAMYFSAFGGWG
jgi:hypothetical protein